MSMFSLNINKCTNSFNWLTITKEIKKRFPSGITNNRFISITGTNRFSNTKFFDESANTADVTDITFSHIIETSRFTDNWWFDNLTSPANVKKNVHSFFEVVALLEKRALLKFNGLIVSLTLLT